MTNFEKTQLTDLGASLVGKCGMDVNFTRVETGCGTYASGEKVGGAVSLKSKVQDISISSATRISEVLSEVKFVISNRELTQDYLLTEIGVYAMDPDEGEILYAVCFATPENSQKIMAYNGIFPYSAVISLKIEISAGAEVHFYTDGVFALAEDYARQQRELDELRNNLKGVAPSIVVNGGDFDDMMTPGLYMMRNATKHAPDSRGYYSLIVLKSDIGYYVHQIAIADTETFLYVRRHDSYYGWSAWDKVLMKSGIVDNLVTSSIEYALSAHMGVELNTRIENLKKSVSDGKSSVASAITAMGVSTASDAAFSTMGTNIRNISKDATAYASDIISGKSAYCRGSKISGSIMSAVSAPGYFVGGSFAHSLSGSPRFAAYDIGHISYKQFRLHYTINTYSWGKIEEYSDWNAPKIIVTGSGGNINVLRSSWSLDVTNYSKMYVSIYGKSDYVGGGMEFRGCVGVCAKGATSSTGGEGRDYSLSYVPYEFTSTSPGWGSPLEVDLSWINQEVEFHMSTVHAGEIYLCSIGFVPK